MEPSSFLRIDHLAIAVAAWRGHHQEAQLLAGIVAHLVRRAGRHVEALPRPETMRHALQLQRGGAAQHVEELPRAHMPVAHLGGAGGHAFLDHAEVIAGQQMPAVALLAPDVMCCVGGADGGHGCVSSLAERGEPSAQLVQLQLVTGAG